MEKRDHSGPDTGILNKFLVAVPAPFPEDPVCLFVTFCPLLEKLNNIYYFKKIKHYLNIYFDIRCFLSLFRERAGENIAEGKAFVLVGLPYAL